MPDFFQPPTIQLPHDETGQDRLWSRVFYPRGLTVLNPEPTTGMPTVYPGRQEVASDLVKQVEAAGGKAYIGGGIYELTPGERIVLEAAGYGAHITHTSEGAYNWLTGFFTDTGAYAEALDSTLCPPDQYAYIVIQWPVAGILRNPGQSWLQAIQERHPNAKILAYQNFGGMIGTPYDVGFDGITRPTSLVTQAEAVTHGTGPDDWRLRLTAGGAPATFCDYSFLQWAHIGLSTWQTQATNHFAQIAEDGFDGIAFDDVNPQAGHCWSDGFVTQIATEADYRSHVIAAMAAIAPAARSAGLLIVPNVGMDPWTAPAYAGYQAMLANNSIDGSIREFWMNWGTGAAGASPFTGAAWRDVAKILTDAELAGKFLVASSYPLNPVNDFRMVDYGLASFWLHHNPNAVVSPPASAFGYNSGKPASIYGRYRELLGTPLESRQVVVGNPDWSDTAGKRRFAGGIVCINARDTAGTVTIPLGETHLDYEGNPVTSIDLAPGFGAILLKAA